MIQPGRKSAAALAVVGEVSVVSRVPPPAELTDSQRALWMETVNSKPAEWFGPEHVPLLLEYVRHVATADMLSRQIEAFDAAWLADDDGLKRLKTLTTMRTKEAQVINTLARSMRLTQQAIYRADKAATLVNRVRGGRKPWQLPEEG